MTVLLSGNHSVAGTVKFDTSVPIEKLTDFIIEMKSRNPERWVYLNIRGVGKSGAHYMSFQYILPDGEKKTHAKVVNSLF